MTKPVDKNIELARWFDERGAKKSLTIKQYLELVAAQDREQISDFIFHRLYGRYLKPFSFEDETFTEQFKNGFSIMANCCLLIETLQSFKNGWGDSNRKSESAFKQFLATEKRFSVFVGKEREFYTNVRCGILHQGETTGGWKINRKGVNLFDVKSLTVDSIKFAYELEKCLNEYSNNLKNAEWDSDLWDNFRVKMRKIISNCTI